MQIIQRRLKFTPIQYETPEHFISKSCSICCSRATSVCRKKLKTSVTLHLMTDTKVAKLSGRSQESIAYHTGHCTHAQSPLNPSRHSILSFHHISSFIMVPVAHLFIFSLHVRCFSSTPDLHVLGNQSRSTHGRGCPHTLWSSLNAHTLIVVHSSGNMKLLHLLTDRPVHTHKHTRSEHQIPSKSLLTRA